MSLSLGPPCRLCPKLGQPRCEERGVVIRDEQRRGGRGRAQGTHRRPLMHTRRECKIHRERKIHRECKTRYERLMWAAKTGNNTA